MLDEYDVDEVSFGSRPYFYKDNKGNNVKYTYCCLCQKGPFKLKQKNVDYITVGDVSYCNACIKILGLTLETSYNACGIRRVTKEIKDSCVCVKNAPGETVCGSKLIGEFGKTTYEKLSKSTADKNPREHYIYIAEGTTGKLYAGISVNPQKTESYSNKLKNYKEANEAGLPIKILWSKKIGNRREVNDALSIYKLKSQKDLKKTVLQKDN